jgi:ABC-type phosphate transport system auxiliary subunit
MDEELPESKEPEKTNPVPESQLDPRTRAQARKQLHEARTKQRKADFEQLRAEYAENKENPVVLDILAKAKSFRDYHTQLAVDGVGAKVVADPDGQDGQRVVDYELTKEQTFRELGGSSALVQLITYIEKQLAS